MQLPLVSKRFVIGEILLADSLTDVIGIDQKFTFFRATISKLDDYIVVRDGLTVELLFVQDVTL